MWLAKEFGEELCVVAIVLVNYSSREGRSSQAHNSPTSDHSQAGSKQRDAQSRIVR